MRAQHDIRSAIQQLLCECHALQLTLAAGSLGAANLAVAKVEVGSCIHERSA